MRRTSVSLPTKHVAHDPHEKPARYHPDGQAGILEKLKAGMASQAQKTRWFKTGAIVLLVFFLFYYFSPSGVDLYHGSGMTCESKEKQRTAALTQRRLQL